MSKANYEQIIKQVTTAIFQNDLTIDYLDKLQNVLLTYISQNPPATGKFSTLDLTKPIHLYHFSYDYSEDKDHTEDDDENLKKALLTEIKYLQVNGHQNNPSGKWIWIFSPVASTFIIVSNYDYPSVFQYIQKIAASHPINYAFTEVKEIPVELLSTPRLQMRYKHLNFIIQNDDLWAGTLALFLTL